MIKIRPVRDVLYHDDQKKNTHTDKRENVEIRGSFCNCFMDVCKMTQKLSGRTKHFTKNSHLAGTNHCW
jgi:hypothetical protein